MSDDKHLEVAAKALRDEGDWGHMSSLEAVGVAVPVYLDSLLADLPEEAVEAARDWLSRYAIWSVQNVNAPFEERKAVQLEYTENAIMAALRSLRGSTPGGAE